MTRLFTFPRAPRDTVRESRVDELLRIASAFVAGDRSIPGHVLRELVQLHEHWGKREIPAAAVDAAKRLGRTSKREIRA